MRRHDPDEIRDDDDEAALLRQIEADYDLGTWTPALVGHALIWALRCARTTAGPTGPKGFGQGTLAVIYAPDEIAMMAAPEVPRVKITPQSISQMEAILAWHSEHLVGATTKDIVDVLNGWLRCRVFKVRFGKWCDRKGINRRTAYRRVDRALSIISTALDRSGAPVWRVS